METVLQIDPFTPTTDDCHESAARLPTISIREETYQGLARSHLGHETQKVAEENDNAPLLTRVGRGCRTRHYSRLISKRFGEYALLLERGQRIEATQPNQKYLYRIIVVNKVYTGFSASSVKYQSHGVIFCCFDVPG